MLFVLFTAVALATMLWWLLLWYRQARRQGESLSPALFAWGLLIPLIGGGFYLGMGHDPETREWLGEYDELRDVARELAEGRTPEALDPDIPQARLARVLQREMARDPTVEGWYALALIYGELEAPDVAVEAARHALEMQPSEHTRILLARSLMAREQGALTDESRALLEEVIAEQPDHDGAWMLLGMGATHAGRHELAVYAWESMLERHGVGEAGPVLERSLAFSRDQLERQEYFDGVEITVDASEVPPGGSLFVFLRREGQFGQPLAARQVLAERFPMTVELRRQDWLQTYPEAGDEALEVGARYSPSAGAGVGDAEFRAEPRPFDPEDLPTLELE